MGTHYSFASRNANHCKVGHIFGIEMQGIRVTPEYTVTKYGYY
jgi:hypothetical protein